MRLNRGVNIKPLVKLAIQHRITIVDKEMEFKNKII